MQIASKIITWKIKKVMVELDKGQLKGWVMDALETLKQKEEAERIKEAVAKARAEAENTVAQGRGVADSTLGFLARMLG